MNKLIQYQIYRFQSNKKVKTYGIKSALAVLIFMFSNSSFSQTWTGTTSTDWNTAANWSPSGVPLSTGIVSIPGGLTNYPVVNNTVSIATITVNNTGSGATLTVTTGGALTATGLITVNANGTLTVNGGTATLAGITSAGNVSVSGGTTTSTTNLILNNGAVMTQSGGLIHMAANTATTPSDHLVIASGGTLTQSGGTLYIKDWLAGSGTFNQTGSTALFKIFRNWKPGTGSTFNSTAGTVQFSGGATAGDFSTGTRQFSNIIVDAGIIPDFSNTAGSTIPISGNFTNNNTTLNITVDATFTFNGTGTQTITSAATGTNATFGNLEINTTSTVTLASNIYVAGNLSVLAGTFDQGSYTVTRSAAGGALSMSSGTYLTAGAGMPANFTANTFSSGSSVIFNGSGTETIPAYNYFNLTCSNTGARILASTGTIGIAGVFTPGTNVYTITGSTINFNGTGSQTIPAFDYNNLTTSGARTSNNLTYSGTGIIKIAGTFSPGATFTTGSRIVTGSTIEFSSTGAQTIPAFTYFNLSTSGARTTNSLTYSSTGIIYVAGAFSPNSTFTTGGRIITGSTFEFNGSGAQTIPAFNFNNLTSSNTGSRTLASSGTIGVAGNFTPGTNTFTVTGSTVDFNGSGAQTIGGLTFNNLTTSNAGTKSSSGNITVNGTFTVTSPTIFAPGATDVISGTGTLTGSGTIQVTRITGTPDLNSQYTISNKTISTLGVNYIGAGAQTVSALNYGTLTISTNGTRTVTLESSGTIGITGTFSPTATTTTYVVTGSTVDFNGSGAQTIPAFTFNDLNTSIGGSKTSAGNIAVNGIFTVASPTVFSPGATHIISGSGRLTGTGEIEVTRITATVDFATQYSITSKTITDLTITYNGAGAQTINSTFGNYKTLKIGGSGIKSLQGAITVTGDIIINAGTLDVTASNFGITISGNFTNNVAALNFTERLGTVTFTGSSSAINGTVAARTFYNIVINKTPGQTLTMGGSVTSLTVNDFTETTGNFIAPTTFTINGNVLLVAGTFTTGTVTIAGNWTNNGGTVNGTSVTFSGTAKTIGGSTTSTFPNLTITTGSVTLNTNASCTAFTLANNAVANSFAISNGVSLTVNGNAVINQASANAVIHSLNVNGGTLTVNGNLTISVTASIAGRVARMIITTGTVNITGDLIMNNALLAANGVIDMSGGAGNLNIYGNFTVSTLITFTAGTTSTVTYLGTGAQSVAAGASVVYRNLVINKPSGTATLSAALSAANVTLTQGTLSVSASNYNITLSGNWTSNGGTFSAGSASVTLNGTGTVSGTTSTSFAGLAVGAGSTGYTMNNNNSCSSLTFTASGTSSTFTHSGTAALIVNGIVTINQPTGGGFTTAWNINNGTATVSGLITLAGTSTTTTRISKIVITTGTLNANGGMTLVASANATKVIDMSGGAGTLNLKGALTVPALSGTLTAGTAGSIFNYADNAAAQTVNFFPAGAYHNLHINTTGSTGATLSAAIATTNVTGNLKVQSGTLSNGAFAIALNTSKTFEVANAATFKMTGISGMVTGTTITKTFGATSTVEYSGTNQTVSAETYGHLIFSSSTGAAVKTMPATAFTVAGNFSSNIGAGTSVSYTAASNITFSGLVTIGASTTFDGGSFSHTAANNWVNNGTFTGSTSTITLSGTSATISGSGAHNFNNLVFSGLNISSSSSITVSGNLSTSDVGSFTHNTGGTLTMSGTSKTISGTGFTLNDIIISGSISSVSDVLVAGNLTINSGGSLSTTGGNITMTGASKTITATGTLSFYNLTVSGSVTTASNFTISSALNVTGSLTATAGTVTFTGTSVLSGTPNLFNVTLNCTSLQLSTNSILGIAAVYTITAGTLNVTSTTPNTVNFNSTGAQNVNAGTYNQLSVSNGNAKTALGIITANGTFTIGASTTFVSGSYTHNLKSHFTNSGTFTSGTGTIEFSGSADATITGATTFNIININKTVAANTVSLVNNISVATINMTLGSVNTGSSTLTITTTRTGAGIILGNIQRTHSFTTGVAYEFEGQSNTITFASVSSVTSVLVKVTSGSIADFPFGGSINRLYDITIPAGTYNATLRLHYEDAELNGNSESTMSIWKFNSTWAVAGKTSNSTTLNYVELSGLTSIATRWTCSDNNNVVSWNGSVSSNWATAANWTSVQGSPSMPPSSAEIVQIGSAAYTNAPQISTVASAKSILFGSAVSATLSLTAGGSLTTQGNISGSWSANASHTINVNGQTLTINGDLILSDGTTNHKIDLNVTTGSVSLTGSLTESAGANITFNGAGALTIGSNFTYVSGTFTPSTGTVTYNGTAAQTVAPVTYYNLIINKSAGIATMPSATTLNGNLTISSGELDFNNNLTVAGNVAISSATILYNLGYTINVGGNWSNSGTYTSSSGTNNFNGTGAQSISASTFNNLNFNKPSGTATLTGNVSVNSNVTLTTGNVDLATYTLNRSSSGGVFTIAGTSILYVGGANNFPANYTTNTLSSTSTVEYNGTVAQTVLGLNYGNLILSNGTTNAKTLAASAFIYGNLTINSGASFTAGAYTINLDGNWTNNGTFTSSTGIVNLDGIGKTITGNTTFNKVSIFGSYTIAGTNISTNGLFTIATGASLAGGTGTITINADFTNNGTFSSTGTVTFSGTVLQTLQFVNATTNLNIVNFNGTVSPSLSSTTSPVYNTVNINNTGGITALIGWTINTALNVSSGANFNAGSVTHTLYGSFTNNGTVSSSGTLSFEPASAQTLQLKGTSFTSTGTIYFGGTGAVTVTGVPNTLKDVTIANTTGVSPSSNWSIGGNFIINTNAIFNAETYGYTIAGNFVSNGTLNGGTSSFTLSSASGSLSGSTNTSFYDLVISGNISALSDYNVMRNFTNNGTYDGSSGKLTMTGTSASVIGGTASPYNLAKLSVQKSAGISATLANNITSVQILDVASGIFDASTYSITQDAVNGGTLTIADNATLKIAGTNSLPTFNIYALSPLSTVNYYGTTQSISVASSYGNLTISAAGTKTAAGALAIGNNFSLSNGTFVGGSFTHVVNGSWSMTSGTFTNTGTTIELGGTGTQNISSTGAFSNLTINKTSGSTLLLSDVTINGTLTFAIGNITTGTYKVIVPSGGSISGAGEFTGWVNGNLQKYIAAIAGSNFETGGALYYSPVSLTFASVTTAGSVIAKATPTAHPNVASSSISANNITRYWSLSLPASGALVFTNATVSLNWNTADNYANLSTSNIGVALYSSSAWSYPTPTGTPTNTSIQVTNISLMGDYAVGELACAVTTWTGALSSQWDNGGNWTCGVTPTAFINVVVPGSLSTYPLLNSGLVALANNVTIQSGGSITVSSATLKIGGILSSSGTFTATTGTIEFNGTSAQTIPAASFATNTIRNLTINNTAGVTLAGTLNITGDVTISGGSLTTGGYLTLKSSATATARIARITSVAATPLNGNITVERFIQGRRKYRIITSPVTTHANATLTSGQEAFSIWGNWQTSGSNTAGTGNIITGGTSADGFDQHTSTASVYTYDAANRNFVGFTTANGKNTKYTPLKAGVPYYMFVYGDRTNSIISATPGNTTLSSTGALLTGDQTYTTSSSLPLSGVTGRYTMIGNPFASPIDWGTVVKTNIASTYWGWDPNLSSTGGYVTVTTTGTATLISPYSGTTGLNQYIQPGQGFFVQTNAASPQLVIREQDKVSNFNANAFRTRGANDVPLIAINLLYDNAGTKVLADGVLAAFDTAFSNSIGKEDAGKMTNSAENIAIVNGTELLSIDARQLPQKNDSILLNILRLKKPKYTLQIFVQKMEAHNAAPYLEDKYLGTSTQLSITDTNRVEFDVDPTKASSFDANRFKIIFRGREIAPTTVLSLTAVLKDKYAEVEWKVLEDNTVKKYAVEHSNDNISFSKKVEVAAKGSNTAEVYKWVDMNLSAGKNYYRIRTIYADGRNSLSKSVVINLELPAAGIKVFPNPVKNQLVNLKIINLEQGLYKVQLINSNGYEVFSKTIDHAGGSTSLPIQIINRLSNGIYYLGVMRDKARYSQVILVEQ